MSVIEGVLLGLLQGVAEFLPISSSGHLAIVQELFDLDDVPLLFDVLLHLATLAAVVLFFRQRIWALLKVAGRWLARKSLSEDEGGLKTILALLLGTAVTAVFGLVLSDVVEDFDEKLICVGFLVTAGLLIFSDAVEERRRKRPDFNPGTHGENQCVTPLQGLGIGLAQGFGVLPGLSRSGSTIAGALLCGVNRETAGEFSFLLSIPAILGAFVLQLDDLDEMGAAVGLAPALAGGVAAFVAGIFSLAVLMRIVRRGKLEWFALYLIPAGILGLVFL